MFSLLTLTIMHTGTSKTTYRDSSRVEKQALRLPVDDNCGHPTTQGSRGVMISVKLTGFADVDRYRYLAEGRAEDALVCHLSLDVHQAQMGTWWT